MPQKDDAVAACLEREKANRIERTNIETTFANPEAIRMFATKRRLDREALSARQNMSDP